MTQGEIVGVWSGKSICASDRRPPRHTSLLKIHGGLIPARLIRHEMLM
jgi:hypothetical protein